MLIPLLHILKSLRVHLSRYKYIKKHPIHIKCNTIIEVLDTHQTVPVISVSDVCAHMHRIVLNIFVSDVCVHTHRTFPNISVSNVCARNITEFS